MSGQWFAKIDGVTAGPFDVPRLRELAGEGKVTLETPVRLGGESWTRAGDVTGLLSADLGGRQSIAVDPSMNDTTEWRMLAETAPPPPAADPPRPLPRLTPASAPPGDPAPASVSRATVVKLAVAAVLVAAVVAVVVTLSFAG